MTESMQQEMPASEAPPAPTDDQMEAAAERMVRRALGRRDAPWSEKTPEERLEALRQELRSLRSEIEALGRGHTHLSRDHYTLREEFGHHRHIVESDQLVAIPAQRGGGFPMGIGVSSVGSGRKDSLA